MRGFLVCSLSLLTCFTSGFNQGWEWQHPLPQGNLLVELEYLGDNQLLATGHSGEAIASTDGGASWTLRSTGEFPHPTIVDFVSPAQGWGLMSSYVGFGPDLRHAIMHTTDGGLSWFRQHNNPHVELTDIAFPSPDMGWAVGNSDSTSNLVIMHTTDGGQTWTEQFTDSSGNHAHVFFLNEQEGWISLNRSTWHTTNGGATWSCYSTPYWMYFGIQFVDSQNGWGAGFGDAYRTTDGGQTWLPQGVPLVMTETVHSVAAADADHIWAVTGADDVHIRPDRMFYSSNGGTTWERRALATTSDLYKVVFADVQRGWVCGDDGTIYQTTDGGGSWLERGGDGTTAELSYSCVDFVDHQNGWIGGWNWDTGSPILHTTDGGTTWNQQLWDSTGYFAEICALSSSNIWAAGRQLLHSTDGGGHWEPASLPGSLTFQDLECVSEQIVWAASGWHYPPLIHRTTDGGLTWISREVPINAYFNGMAAAGDSHVWVANWADLDQGELLHSSDAGLTWEEQAPGFGYVDGVYFLDERHGWAGAWCGVIRTTDGGETWTVAGPDSNVRPYALQFQDTLNGWALDYNDAYRTIDGGTTWRRFDPFAGTRLSDFDFLDQGNGWVVGWHGTLMRFDSTMLDAPAPPAAAPSVCALHPAYPNPFNTATTLTFDLTAAGPVRVEIFDVTGRLVRTLSDQAYSRGRHKFRFAADGLPSGFYFVHFSSATFHSSQKLILLR